MLMSKRLILREIEEEDFCFYKEMLLDKEIMNFIPSLFSTSKEIKKHHQELMKDRSRDERDRFFFIIQNKETKDRIGFISMKITSSGVGTFGYIISNLFKGKGYATEASKALLGFAFNLLNLQKVEASSAADNIPSVKVLKKIMMNQIKKEKDSFEVNGKRHDELVFQIQRTEYQAIVNE